MAARHLANRGRQVTVVLAEPESMSAVPAHQLDILQRMGGVESAAEPRPAPLIIDALIGYSLRGDPTGSAAAFIAWMNEQSASLLSLDTPSVLDVTTGLAARPCVHASATMTLALPKRGLLHAPEVGALYLADISVPRAVYRLMGIDVEPLFRDSPIVELTA